MNNKAGFFFKQISIEIDFTTAETSLILYEQFNNNMLHTFAVANILNEKAPLVR